MPVEPLRRRRPRKFFVGESIEAIQSRYPPQAWTMAGQPELWVRVESHHYRNYPAHDDTLHAWVDLAYGLIGYTWGDAKMVPTTNIAKWQLKVRHAPFLILDKDYFGVDSYIWQATCSEPVELLPQD